MKTYYSSNGMPYQIRRAGSYGVVLTWPVYEVLFKRGDGFVLGGDVWKDGQSWAWTPRPGRKHESDCDRRVDAVDRLAEHVAEKWEDVR